MSLLVSTYFLLCHRMRLGRGAYSWLMRRCFEATWCFGAAYGLCDLTACQRVDLAVKAHSGAKILAPLCLTVSAKRVEQGRHFKVENSICILDGSRTVTTCSLCVFTCKTLKLPLRLLHIPWCPKGSLSPNGYSFAFPLASLSGWQLWSL